MTDETATEPGSGRAALVEALSVRRNARRGFAFGGLFAAGVFVLFVVVPGSRSPLLYVGLAFVLAVTTGLLATAALVTLAAYRLTKEL